MNLSDLPAYYTTRIVVDGDCWRWMGAMVDGMPASSAGHGRTRWVRRELFEREKGEPIADGRVVTLNGKECQDRCCVAPGHAIEAKRGQHIKLAVKHRGLVIHDAYWLARLTAGRRARSTKMSMAKARDVRRRVDAGEDRDALALEYDIHSTMIDKIYRNENWREANNGLTLLAQQAGML